MRGMKDVRPKGLRLASLCAALLLCTACSGLRPEAMRAPEQQGLDPELVTRAVENADLLNASGRRVWCVPFARDASGIFIRGNAGTWYDSAAGDYLRGRRPEVGAVMAFSSTRKLPMGHVAVVSRVVSEREVLIDHANWHRSQVSLGMAVVDVSEANDWSSVRVESQPGSLGRVYPLDGFIYPNPPEYAPAN